MALICPKCKSGNTCEISYGYPGDEEEYLKLVAEKKIYPGGCIIEDDSPSYYCNNCGHKWGQHNTDSEDFKVDPLDSFDYDQGFSLDEVYG